MRTLKLNTIVDKFENPFNNKFSTKFAWGAAIGGLASIGGSILGSNAKDKANKSSAAKLQAGVDRIESVDTPTVEDQMIQLQQLKLSGELTPEQIEVVDQKMSELKSIVVDPTLKDAQMRALMKLQQIGSEGGLTAVDRAQLEDTLSTTRREGQSQRNAILQNAAQRGMSGSGLEQAAQLMAQQNDATNASNEGFKTAALAQQRALDAIMQGGTLGGQIRDQDFNQQAKVAAAQDSINNFNTANKQNILAQNTAARNNAQQSNLVRKDLEATTNNALANQQETANKGLQQTAYQNQMEKAKAISNAYSGQAQQASAQGDSTANMWSNLGSGISKVGAGIADYELSDKKKKDKE